MNLFEGHGNREAKIRYLDADFEILIAGLLCRCAMTGKHIPARRAALLERCPPGPYADVISALDADKAPACCRTTRR